MLAHLVARKLLVVSLVTGEMRLAIAVDQVGEGDAVRRTGCSYNGGQGDRNRGITIAKRRHPFRSRGHRPARPRRSESARGARESAGGVSAASSWTPSTWPRTSTWSTPVFTPCFIVMTITSPRA